MEFEVGGLFVAGTIRDLFAPWRSASISKGLRKVSHPLAINQSPLCAHIMPTYDEAADAVYNVRCAEEALNQPPHGFLCAKHFNHTPTIQKGGDDGYTDYLLMVEVKAIKAATIENHFGLKVIADLRMKNDPKPYQPKEVE